MVEEVDLSVREKTMPVGGGRKEGVRMEKGKENRGEERSNTSWEVYQVLKQVYAAPGLQVPCESVQ